MKIRQAIRDEIDIDCKFMYQKNPDNCVSVAPIVTIIGFVPYFVGDSEDHTAWLARMPDGQIILGMDRQLFVKM